MQRVLAPHLTSGQTIGLLSPSSSIARFPRRFKRGKDALSRCGFRVLEAAHVTAYERHSAGSIGDRVSDLHDLFRNPDVHGIVCTTGGWTANTLLTSIDYELIGRHPKVFCGFSDITALNLAIHAKTGLVTFNGPSLLPSFGGPCGPLTETVDGFLAAVSRPAPIGLLPTFTRFTTEYLEWDREDVRPRTSEPTAPWQNLNNGLGQGRSVVGELSTLTALAGTPFFPELRGKVLFVEHSGSELAPAERCMAHLDMLGAFRELAALVFARSVVRAEDRCMLNEMVREYACRNSIPALAEVDFGHTEPSLTLPIGVQVHVQVAQDASTIDFVEEATY